MAKKVLIVEDEKSLLAALKDKVGDQGYRVFTATDGKQALKGCSRERPDLILLDLMMPKMDGVTMLKKLRTQDKWGKEVPVIILTNLGADDAMIKDVMETKPVYYLLKSEVTLKEVVQTIKDCLKA